MDEIIGEGVGGENNAVGITHRNGRHTDISARCRHRCVDEIFLPLGADGDALAIKDRLTHIYGDALYLAILAGEELEGLDAGKGLEGSNGASVGQSVVINIFAYAARGIATHLSFRAVGVEHTHPEVGNIGGEDKDDTIASNAEMAVAHSASEGGDIVRNRGRQAVDINIIVACALHFGEGNCFHLFAIGMFQAAKVINPLPTSKKNIFCDTLFFRATRTDSRHGNRKMIIFVEELVKITFHPTLHLIIYMRHLPTIISALALLVLLTSAYSPSSLATGGPSLSDSVAPITFPGSQDAIIGLYIEEISTGEVVAEYGADRAMCPASIMKAVTSASVLSLYPETEHFVTRATTIGEIVDNTLCGDIVIEASGDPTLGSDYFDAPHAMEDSLVAALTRLGIDSIAGAIRIHNNAIPDPSYPPGWGDDDYMWPYGAMLRPLNWRDNRYTLEIPSKISTPHIPGLKVDFVRRRRGGLKWDAVPPLTTVSVVGRVGPRGASTRLAMPDPAKAFIYAMTSALADSGIVVGNNAIAYNDGEAEELTAVASPPFPEILRSLMHRSDNLMAEGMLRTIAPRQPRDTATTRETTLWGLRGADTDSIRIIDGSGLSRLNRLTPWFLADVLAWMARSPRADQYTALFPKVGEEGTVRNFLAKTPLQGRLALKTGTMSSVRALAGYKLDSEGRPTHAVVLIVNRFSCSPAAVNRGAAEFFLKFFGEE